MARKAGPGAEAERILARFRSEASLVTLERSDFEGPEPESPPEPRRVAVLEPPEPQRIEVPVQESVEPARTATVEPLRPVIKEPAEPAFVPAPPSRLPLYALCLAVLVGLGLAVRQWRAWDESRIHRVFPLPFAATSSLAVEGSTLQTVDPARGLMFTLAASKDGVAVTSIQKFPVFAPDGLARTGASLWSSDAVTGRILRHSAFPPYGIEAAFTNPDSRPADLAWDGKYLWSLDRRTGTVSQNTAGASLFPMAQFTLPAMEPAGMRAGEGSLWVFDQRSRGILRFKASGILARVDSLDLSEWLAPGQAVTGMAVSGGTLWVAAQNPAELHRFDLERLEKRVKAPGR
ncbi:MAG: hypothetical protein WC943_16460 [Elusimicrobiota bacterium]|jgi:hypothetical protein